jgi:hypothetical protein
MIADYHYLFLAALESAYSKGPAVPEPGPEEPDKPEHMPKIEVGVTVPAGTNLVIYVNGEQKWP